MRNWRARREHDPSMFRTSICNFGHQATPLVATTRIIYIIIFHSCEVSIGRLLQPVLPAAPPYWTSSAYTECICPSSIARIPKLAPVLHWFEIVNTCYQQHRELNPRRRWRWQTASILEHVCRNPVFRCQRLCRRSAEQCCLVQAAGAVEEDRASPNSINAQTYIGSIDWLACSVLLWSTIGQFEMIRWSDVWTILAQFNKI